MILDRIFDAAGVGLCLLDPAGKVRRANEAWLRSAGLTREAALGRDVWELFPETPPELRRLHDEVRAGRPVEVPAHRQRVGDRDVWLEGHLSPVLLEDGTGILVTAVDVTERERAEAELRRYQLLATLSRDVVLLLRRDDGRILEANAAAEAAYGYTRDELLGLHVRDLRAPGTVHLTEAQMAEADAHGVLFETVHRRKDGSTFPVEVSSRGASVDGTRTLLSVVRDVTLRRRAEVELQAANARLVEDDRRKTEFLAVLSHELRNPLAPIRNALVLLDRAAPGSDVERRAREVLERQTDHLTRLVDDLLDLTRVTHGKIELRRARVDAREVVHRATEDLRPIFAQRRVALAQVLGEPAWVDADAARLAQLVGNLLTNALKFTPEGGEVRVTVQRREDVAEIAVRDTGVGIDAGDLDRIFDPFVQSERARQGGHGGLGIGLALVRQLAVQHGGAVRAASDGPGRGAEFVVTLPLVVWDEEPAPPRRAVAARPALSVLIVEDNEDAGATLADLLALEGQRTEVVGTGWAGIDAAVARRPDVLICDIGLPDLSGYEVIRAVRAAAGGGRPYAVALTGYAQPEDRARALEAGFDAHLSKPPSLEALLQVLAAAARRRS